MDQQNNSGNESTENQFQIPTEQWDKIEDKAAFNRVYSRSLKRATEALAKMPTDLRTQIQPHLATLVQNIVADTLIGLAVH